MIYPLCCPRIPLYKKVLKAFSLPIAMVVLCFGQTLSSPADWQQIVNPTRGAEYHVIQHTALGWFAAGSNGLVRYSPDGRRWFWSQGDSSIPGDRAYRALAHFAGRTFVVGESGTILKTSDGIHWNHQILEDSIKLTSIASDGNCLVLVGSQGRIWRSENGNDWTLRPSPVAPSDWRQVISTQDGFVSVGERGTLAVSPDGRDWQDRSNPDFLFQQVASKGSQLMALIPSRKDSFGMQPNTILARSSNNGVSWLTDTTFSGFNSYIHRFNTLRTDSVNWYAVDEYGSILKSSDGIQWTFDTLHLDYSPYTDPFNQPLGYFQGTWIATGTSVPSYPQPVGLNLGFHNDLVSSSDLRKWEKVSASTLDDHVVAVQPRADGWWLLRSQGNYPLSPTTIQRTRDFVHWEERFVGKGFPRHLDTCQGSTIAYGAFLSCKIDSSLVATCDTTRASFQSMACRGDQLLEMISFGSFSSILGRVVSRLSFANASPVDSVLRMAAVNGVRVVGGKWITTWHDTVWQSLDARSWTSTAVPYGLWETDMASNGNVLVLFSDTGKILRTTDGEHWLTVPIRSAAPFRVTWTGSFFGLVGDENTVGWSGDGLSWQFDSISQHRPPGHPAISMGSRNDSLIVGVTGGDLFIRSTPVITADINVRKSDFRITRSPSRIEISGDGVGIAAWRWTDPRGQLLSIQRIDLGPNRVGFEWNRQAPGALILQGRGVTKVLLGP